MHFKLEYSVTPLILPTESPLRLDLCDSEKLNVTIRCPTREELDKGFKNDTSFCTACLTREPSEKVRQVFEQIDANKFRPANSEFFACEYSNAQGVRIRTPGPDEFPEFFQLFLNELRTKLHDAAQRATRILRWRTNEPGPPRPFGSIGFSWSFDGEHWYPVPSKLSVLFLGSHGTVHLLVKEQTDIIDLLQSGHDEPISHILFREAWEQRVSNPGSALVIGMTSLEVGVKHLIGALVPNASWLAMNLPTPPLIQILSEYLPNLPTKCSFSGKVKSPPPAVLEELRKAVALRNGLAHRGQRPPDFEALERILRAVKDCLWLFDYYGGHSWASEFIRPDTLAALQ